MPSVPLAPGVPSKRAHHSDDAPSSKHRRAYRRRHELRVKQSVDPAAAPILPYDDGVSLQLERAIDLVLRAVGFSHAEPQALQSLRALVEEYMSHFLETVRTSMAAARRVQPLPHDFLLALEKNQLTLRSLLVHLDPPVTAADSQPALFAEVGGQGNDDEEAQLIHRLLSQASLSTEAHVPRNFPSLPSRHTFKAEAIFTMAQRDQTELREIATEEGRLGEEALRRLMSKKASGDDTLLTGLRAGSRFSFRQRSRALWRETYDKAIQGTSIDAMEVDNQDKDTSSNLRPAVNADSAYWRKPIARKITENVVAD